MRVSVLLLLVSIGTASAGSPDGWLTVGAVRLHRCATSAPWCGNLTRPIDPTGTVLGTIAVYFEFWPHSGAGASAGTLVATEGGPGYPATDSRDSYLDLFGPLRATHDILIMDNRGTGRSAPIDCEPLQTDALLTEENVGQCGRSLGARAQHFGAAAAADDLAAILDALELGRIDLYGDSYGTFFEQVFATRHPDRLRSIVLDGAYPLGGGPDYAWYPHYAPAMRTKFARVCERSPECRQRPGTTLERIEAALAALRSAPFDAKAFDADGHSVRVHADASALATLMFSGAPAQASLRELDAAVRSFVGGDTVPLLRLMAEAQVSTDSRDATRSAAKFSAGLAAVAMCTDAPQIFDMSLDPRRRLLERDTILAQARREHPDLYAPFSIDEFRGMPLDYAFIDECVRWPALEPTDHRPSGELVAGAARLPDVPALVVSGDLDDMTPSADADIVAHRFPHAISLLVPNGLHVNALPHSRSACPAQIVRTFLRTLRPGDTSCLAQIPAIRLMPAFVRRYADLDPLRALPGNGSTPEQLRAASAALLTVADVLDRLDSNTGGQGRGLRGGSFAVRSDAAGEELTLHEVRWTEDLAVSGVVHWPHRKGAADATLRLAGASAASGVLKIGWTEGVDDAQATVTGRLGKSNVAARSSAP